MFRKYFKQVLLIVFMGFLCGAQSKECYSCEGINCLRTSKVTNKATCNDSLDSCVTVFEGFTVVARGCYSTLAEVQRNKCDQVGDSECHKCYKSLCNDKGAISCIQCNSEDNADCYSRIANFESTRCPVSTSTNSYCYTRNSSNKIERGCLIDTSEQLKCIDDSSCVMCISDGEDICNRESVDDGNSGSGHVTIYSALLLLTTWLIVSLF